jgi:HKD family nuclease
MQLISNSEKIGKKLSQCIEKYQEYYILTAWASGNNDTFKALLENKSNIKKMVVGTQFYQTNPNFIKSFINSEKVKFMLDNKQQGIYHPKVYLFENNKNDWECLVGSANFTKSALSVNNEIMINFNQDDENSKQMLADLKKQINIYWERSEVMNGDYFDKYKILFKKCKSILNKIDNKFTDEESKKSIIDSKMLALNWENYFNSIQDDENQEYKYHTFDGRLEILETANEYFKEYGFFEKMDKDKRKQIAGTVGENDNWAWFGRMSANGAFHNRIIENNKHISNALDCIPLNGEVSYQNYTDYIDNFRKTGAVNAIGTATRLLAMKRPDVFICLDGKNQKDLCEDFGINKLKSYEEYWNEIIVRIQYSDWWKSEKPKNKTELKAWNGRAAMLDAIYYEPDTE